ncbi:uncharacterized protein PHACADRAFT_247065 [Phanerochaete carnosa HHB-10118-sp]|uniref:Maintenance of telomere capping protein 1 n=1 Tax=Phanerochaete carnosa (strain HHB-10118-sp) TaxID=650164 RepID=K5VD43_PHACS|nr:uncharacterized protein PHACADRAFT_247065 [Phanerochaete carnosa HHB-10118-sp]EKM60866.1 hypothetical protein PHACADRAFT_247065 [Phanerochaete carnosa HHB-10118-sp]
MASKPKSKQEEALAFLDDLDNIPPPPPSSSGAQNAQPPSEGEAEVYAFIDEITQKSSEPPRSTLLHADRPSRAGTPTLRKSTERVRVGASSPLLPTASSSTTPLSATPLVRTESNNSRVSLTSAVKQESGQATPPLAPQSQLLASSSSGWGWNSVWSTASSAIQQARTVVDEQVKNLPKNEQARKWGEGVLEYAKAAQLDKLGKDFKRVGLSTLTDILNVVAPPISEHEVIQVWLSHDMIGYDGVESLVYRALTRIMEQVEGGDLVVNRGDESRPKSGSPEKRETNAVDGLDAAIKLAQAELNEVIKRNVQPPSTTNPAQNPTTYSYVYLRIQPFRTSLSLPSQSELEAESISQTTLQFLLYLADPVHQVVHSTITQAIPNKWLDIWDEYEWVEDSVVEAIRVGVEVIGQEYVVSRMGWDQKKTEDTKVEAELATAVETKAQ